MAFIHASCRSAHRLNAETIRAWQRRYGAIKPRRSENARRFTMEDIRRLSLKKATSAGQAISEIAQLSETELLKIIESSQQHATTERVRDDQLDNIFQEQLCAFVVARYDTGEATKVLSSAALYLETRSFLLEIVIPLMNKIGQDWHSGAMRIGQEHFATEILKGSSRNERQRVLVPEVCRSSRVRRTGITAWCADWRDPNGSTRL